MHIYEVLKRPIQTEKSNYQAEELQRYTFEVDRRANKLEIQSAVEKIFDVHVIAVRVINVRGKKRRMGRHMGETSSWKKAMVTLSAGESISFFEGV